MVGATKRFLLDANFLLLPGQFRVDVFEQLGEFGSGQLYTLNLVIKELEKLTRGRGRSAAHARTALQLVKTRGVKILHARGRGADAAIKRLAGKGYYIVCTQDRALIKSLKKKKVHVITLRQKKYLIRV